MDYLCPSVGKKIVLLATASMPLPQGAAETQKKAQDGSPRLRVTPLSTLVHAGQGTKLPDFRHHCLESNEVWPGVYPLLPTRVKDLLSQLIT